MTVPTLTLNDGVKIPQLGFGTWQVSEDEAHASVATALATGYRHIDTAAIYGNERGVGRALAESGVDRDELFVTTKLWNDAHHADDARRAIETSLDKLGLDHLDLYLIHWPANVKYGDAYIEAWNALQEFKAEGLTRSIGVSNFSPVHLDAIEGAVPSMNQVEMHPTFNQAALRADLAARGIQPEAWSPLGQSKDLTDPTISAIAADLGVSTAQVIIRWHLQIGNVVIPKSVTPSRIAENFDVFGFELSDEQIAAINGVDSGHRLGADPVDADF
ncbi:aldo/keto reductase [Acidipropionibacterium timonense]|uniref:aldo/keto reductase n=1 Tax=Acidipropionibacterium timonense TaxID=2161818 RepID=UPI001030447B|nr:aldo/keto reductase [Acidipropionibacterium timonense]